MRPFRCRQSLGEVESLPFAKNVRVDRKNGTRVISQILRDLVHRSAQPKPGGCCVVAERMAAEPKGELASHSDGELSTEGIREQVVIRLLA